MSDNPNIIGEIIEASTMQFTAESRTLYAPPIFGSFVKAVFKSDALPQAYVSANDPSSADYDPFIGNAGSFNTQYHQTFSGETPEANQVVSVPSLPSAIFGIVYQASTTPANKGSRLRAYWKDEDQLKAEQPQLEEWQLLTEFRAVIIGFAGADGVMRQFIPPQPPKVHTFVEVCTDDEIRAVSTRLDFLRTLANFSEAPNEEVIAACIRDANRARGGDFDFLVSAGKELASLMKDDYDRLQAIIRRIAP